MLRLHAPEKSIDQLKALAASGGSGLALKARAQLRARRCEELAACLRQQREQPISGSAQ